MAKKKKASFGSRLTRGVLVLSILTVCLFMAWSVWKDPLKGSAPPMASWEPDPMASSVLKPNQGIARKEGFYTILLAASDAGGANGDTIMVLAFDTLEGEIGVVSIPRDTIVEQEGQSVPKINASYRGSQPLEQLSLVVSQLLGIPIDYKISVSLSAFVELIDAVGGIEFYVPCAMNYDDPTANPPLSIHYEEGLQHLTGTQAMEVVRFRKNNDGSGYTDIGRTKTQQEMLVAVAKKIFSWGNVGKIQEFIEIFHKHVTTDLEVSHMLWFATQAIQLDLNTAVKTATLPGDGTVTYRGYGWCYALEPEGTLEIINDLLNPYTTPITLEKTKIIVV